MQIQVTGKKMDVGEGLRTQVEDKVRDICQKYNLSPLETTATFSTEGSPFHKMVRCDLEMHLGHGVYVRAHEETDDPHVSLAQAIETFEKRLRRHKNKLVSHQKKRDTNFIKAPAFQYVINSQNEKEIEGDNPLVIAEIKTDIPMLSVSEAVMHLDLSDTRALLFTNSKYNQLNVVYRRDDGNIGWIAPSPNA